MYFVKLDVQACFDTIEQTKLLSILREIISKVRSAPAMPKKLLTQVRMPTPFNDTEKSESTVVANLDGMCSVLVLC